MATMTLPRQPATRAATHYAVLTAASREYDAPRALALVALSCAGLEVSALVRLDVGNLCDLGEAGRMGYHLILGDGTRKPIAADTYSLVVDYLCRSRCLDEPEAPLFISRRGHRLSTKQCRRILASVAARAGVDISSQ